MLDRRARELVAPMLDATVGVLADANVRPLALTGMGWLSGVSACVGAVSHALFCLPPTRAALIASFFSAMVAVTAVTCPRFAIQSL